jgi:hypothetical protein
MAQQAERLRQRERDGGESGLTSERGIVRPESSQEKPTMQHKLTRWYSRKDDDTIIEPWANTTVVQNVQFRSRVCRCDMG